MSGNTGCGDRKPCRPMKAMDSSDWLPDLGRLLGHSHCLTGRFKGRYANQLVILLTGSGGCWPER